MKRIGMIFALTLLVLGSAINAYAAPTLSLGTATAQPGGTASLALNLSGGTEAYAGVNAKIILPTGITARLPPGRSSPGEGSPWTTAPWPASGARPKYR